MTRYQRDIAHRRRFLAAGALGLVASQALPSSRAEARARGAVEAELWLEDFGGVANYPYAGSARNNPNTKAIRAWLSACAAKGCVGRIGPGQFALSEPVELNSDNAEGIIIRGTGGGLNNRRGTELVFQGPNIDGLQVESRGPERFVNKLLISDLNIGCADDFNGSLLRLVGCEQSRLANMQIRGNHNCDLISAAEFVGVHLNQVTFRDGVDAFIVRGREPGKRTFLNVVHFEACAFINCVTSFDGRLACRSVSFAHCYFEPHTTDPDVPVRVQSPCYGGGHDMYFSQCWFGDVSQPQGPAMGELDLGWIVAEGERLVVRDSEIRSGRHAIISRTTKQTLIEGCSLDGTDAAVVHIGRALTVRDSSIFLNADGAVGVDIRQGYGVIEDNDVRKSTAPHGSWVDTIAYLLHPGSHGRLRDPRLVPRSHEPDTIALNRANTPLAWHLNTRGARLLGEVRADGTTICPSDYQELSIDVPGAEPGDIVTVASVPPPPAGLMVSAHVAAAGQVSLQLFNGSRQGLRLTDNALWRVHVTPMVPLT